MLASVPVFFFGFLLEYFMCRVGRSNSRNRNQKQVKSYLESITLKGEYEEMVKGFTRFVFLVMRWCTDRFG